MEEKGVNLWPRLLGVAYDAHNLVFDSNNQSIEDVFRTMIAMNEELKFHMELYMTIERDQRAELEAQLALQWAQFAAQEARIGAQSIEMSKKHKSFWKGKEPTVVEEEEQEDIDDEKTNEEYLFFVFLLYIIFDDDILINIAMDIWS